VPVITRQPFWVSRSTSEPGHASAGSGDGAARKSANSEYSAGQPRRGQFGQHDARGRQVNLHRVPYLNHPGGRIAGLILFFQQHIPVTGVIGFVGDQPAVPDLRMFHWLRDQDGKRTAHIPVQHALRTDRLFDPQNLPGFRFREE
jgi:hypothetical protein